MADAEIIKLSELTADQRYGKTLKYVGKGHHGRIFRGVTPSGEVHAVKEMVLETNKTINRFFREAAIARDLKHPNVVGLRDAWEERDDRDTPLHYIAFEWVEGESLQKRLDRKKFHSIDELEDICTQSLSALDAARELGIIHRDINPKNLMVTKDEEGKDLVKIIDFGIAKIDGEDTDTKSAGIGTIPYWSPEQHDPASRDRLTPATDKYSLGATLFALARNEGLDNHDPRWRPDIDSISRLTPEFKATLKMLLSEKPEDRYEVSEVATSESLVAKVDGGSNLSYDSVSEKPDYKIKNMVSVCVAGLTTLAYSQIMGHYEVDLSVVVGTGLVLTSLIGVYLGHKLGSVIESKLFDYVKTKNHPLANVSTEIKGIASELRDMTTEQSVDALGTDMYDSSNEMGSEATSESTSQFNTQFVRDYYFKNPDQLDNLIELTYKSSGSQDPRYLSDFNGMSTSQKIDWVLKTGDASFNTGLKQLGNEAREILIDKFSERGIDVPETEPHSATLEERTTELAEYKPSKFYKVASTLVGLNNDDQITRGTNMGFGYVALASTITCILGDIIFKEFLGGTPLWAYIASIGTLAKTSTSMLFGHKIDSLLEKVDRKHIQKQPKENPHFPFKQVEKKSMKYKITGHPFTLDDLLDWGQKNGETRADVSYEMYGTKKIHRIPPEVSLTKYKGVKLIVTIGGKKANKNHPNASLNDVSEKIPYSMGNFGYDIYHNHHQIASREDAARRLKTQYIGIIEEFFYPQDKEPISGPHLEGVKNYVLNNDVSEGEVKKLLYDEDYRNEVIFLGKDVT